MIAHAHSVRLTKTDRERFELLKEFHCITCPGCGPTEIHHLLSGNKRIGHSATIPLGAWAHRGVPLNGYTAAQMEAMFGPSLARSSRKFRERYGSDDYLLELVNRKLELHRKLRVA